jgi:hypothetical protein
MLRSYHDLVGVLGAQGMVRRTLPETGMVAIEKESAEVLLRWDDAGVLLHVMQLIPRRITSDRWNAVEVAITRLNHQLTVPGFGLDPDSKMAYYRMVVPRRDDGSLSWEEVVRVLRIVVRTTRTYAHTILGAALEARSTAVATR